MTTTTAPTTDCALEAYEQFAPYYDLFMRPYDYERWLGNLEALAREHGLSGRRLLDVACGTGRSFLPMLARGYRVTACDLSPSMVAEARRVAGEAVDLHVADVRELPVFGEFDLVTCLDDSLNYLLSEKELELAFRRIGGNLRPGGLLLFDLNTLATYRGLFSHDAISEIGDAVFCWRGDRDAALDPGGLREIRIEVFHRSGVECWRRTTSGHVQRHHRPDDVERALARSGLSLLALRGQVTGAAIETPPDEGRHTKLVYLASRRG